MKTLVGLALLALLSGCVAEGVGLPEDEEESVSTAASGEPVTTKESTLSKREQDLPPAPGPGDLSACASCGPGPQPWHRTLEPAAR